MQVIILAEDDDEVSDDVQLEQIDEEGGERTDIPTAEYCTLELPFYSVGALIILPP